MLRLVLSLRLLSLTHNDTFQKSDEPPYDNWRRSDVYSAPGDAWDRSYKVLPGEEEAEAS